MVPDVDECLSSGAPGSRVRCVVVAGFVVAGSAADRAHLGDAPHGDSVLSQLAAEVAGSSCSTGALRIGIDTPLPRGRSSA